jgi:hypothetical protein
MEDQMNVQHRYSKMAQWSVFHVHPHPRNAEILGGSADSVEYKTLLASVRHCGILEPLVIRRDGTILSGHLRFAAALELGMHDVPVVVVEDFPSTREELEFMLRCNTDRRQLTSSQVVASYRRLRELSTPRGKRGGAPGGNEEPVAASAQGIDPAKLQAGKCGDEATVADTAALDRDCAELEVLAERVDEILTRRPLAQLSDASRAREYSNRILELASRAQRELQTQKRALQPRRRARLALVQGGKA